MERALKTELTMGFHGTDCDLSCTCPSDSRALRNVFCQLSWFCLMVILNCIQMLTWLLTALTCLPFLPGFGTFEGFPVLLGMRQAVLYLFSVVEGTSASFTHCLGRIKTMEGGFRQSSQGFGHPSELGPQTLSLLCSSISTPFYSHYGFSLPFGVCDFGRHAKCPLRLTTNKFKATA